MGSERTGLILVTGAAGKTGRAVIRALHERAAPARALVYRQEQAAAVTACGAAEVVIGDMRDAAAMRAALEGVSAVYHIPPNMNPDEVLIGETLIAAAQAAGVTRLVYHSVLHPQVEEMPHHWRKMQVEARLFKSGLDYTILQPTAYMQNLLPQREAILERGRYEVPYSLEARMSLVDLEDVAEAAATVLTEEGHRAATYELVGVEGITPAETAAALSKALGREVQAIQVTIEDWEARARQAGMPAAQAAEFAAMFRYYDRYGLEGNSSVLRHLLGRPPGALDDFVERELRAGV